ncbi:phage holin family protein [Phytohalomonas tamaricis]|uniref:phage holin family protein n=1 Tax=Phytohalomonas tamaricis TaxID=2081032 RepID=UPI0021D46254|nr:phage holin family protein [Phytohalomonas tamaricis]
MESKNRNERLDPLDPEAIEEERGNTAAKKGDSSTSFSSLVSMLMQDVSTLIRQEVQLGKTELSEKMTQIMAAVGSIVTAGVVALGGFLTLLACAVLALSNVLEPWLSALIVGVIALIIGMIMVQAGRKKLKAASLMPQRTMNSVQQDQALARQHAKEYKEQKQ